MSANASTHFRPRPIDINKPLIIMRGVLNDTEGCVRGVPNMPTGMEPEEEEEAHIQEAITASLMLTGEAGALPEIPIPVVTVVEGYDTEVDAFPLVLNQTYIHYRDKTHADYDHIVEYDMDSEDETLLTTINSTNGGKKVLTEEKLEYIIDKFEKEDFHGTDFNLARAEAILKPLKREVVQVVYDHWRRKRETLGKHLICRFQKPPAWDDPSPYIAFRPREKDKEKLKKIRRNDPTALAKMRALRLEMERSRMLLEMLKKRERLKREQIGVVVELYEKLQAEMCKVPEEPPLKKPKKEPATPTGTGTVTLPGPSTSKPKSMPPPTAKPRQQDHYYTFATTSARVKHTPQTCALPYILEPPEARKLAAAAKAASTHPLTVYAPPPKNFLHIPLDYDESDDDDDDSEEDSDEDSDVDITPDDVSSIVERLDEDTQYPRVIEEHIVLGRNIRPFRGRVRVGRGGRVVLDRSFVYSPLPHEREEAERRKILGREGRGMRHHYNHRHYEQLPVVTTPPPPPHVGVEVGESVGEGESVGGSIDFESVVSSMDVDSSVDDVIMNNVDSAISEYANKDNLRNNNNNYNNYNNAQTSFYASSSPPGELDDEKTRDALAVSTNSPPPLATNHTTHYKNHPPASPTPTPTPTPSSPPSLSNEDGDSNNNDDNNSNDDHNSNNNEVFKFTACIEKLPQVTQTYSKKQKRKIDSPLVM